LFNSKASFSFVPLKQSNVAKMKTASTKPETSTEEKIKQAARAVFHRKGFAATRTRDIAEEAGINLALLNYYFRKKEKLFEMIMMETLIAFFQSMLLVYNDETTSIERKVELLTDKYIDLLLAEPEIPLFLVSELRTNPKQFFEKTNAKQLMLNSVMFKQVGQAIKEGKMTIQNPLHFMTNIISLIMFSFVASPMLKAIGNLSEEQFKKLMIERKALIPIWVKATMKAK
jgi:AcrR family transcriptional regulator